MKYLVILCDGMADLPNEVLGNKTPMQVANKPMMDKLCKKSKIGMCKTVADGLKPGSDVANLSVLGYDAKTCYSGRSPLEAANLGIELACDEIAMRCNLVTLSDAQNYEDRVMVDYCGGDISTEEADELIKALQQAFGDENNAFYTGVQYRHCLVSKLGGLGLEFTPPHDISDKVIGEYLSKVPEAQVFVDMMKKSVDILENHPVNIKRKAEGKRPANSAWFWGEGKKPQLPYFKDMFGVNGAVVSAVDLIRGIGKLSKMEVAEIDGVTGYIDTDFDKKANTAKELLSRNDFVFVHLEAPDECGHRGEAENKVKAIELIDEKILTPLYDEIQKYGDFKILIMPDHPTPLTTKTHSSEPVPFMIYDSSVEYNGADTFTEENALATGLYIDKSVDLMPMFLGK
ncbi:MAG: cofactor-independent phosphoglycerate mutase [Clostridia bacterium]|nr:cofactor-independent phosphoglycerate mutase [Clostridia bacterium]